MKIEIAVGNQNKITNWDAARMHNWICQAVLERALRRKQCEREEQNAIKKARKRKEDKMKQAFKSLSLSQSQGQVGVDAGSRGSLVPVFLLRFE